MNATHTCHTTEYTLWISYHRGQGVTQIASEKQPVKLSLKSVGLRAGGSEGVSSDCGVCVYMFIVLMEVSGLRRLGHFMVWETLGESRRWWRMMQGQSICRSEGGAWR